MASPAERIDTPTVNSHVNQSDLNTQDCSKPKSDRISQAWGNNDQLLPFFQRAKSGNILLRTFKQMARSGSIGKKNIGTILNQIEASLKKRNLFPAHEWTQGSKVERYAELCNILAPRRYQSTEDGADASIECVKDPKYASAKDPYELFQIALEEACKELGITADQLDSSEFNAIASPESQHAYRLAVYKVLAQADVALNDSNKAPYVKFNDYLTASYQKPILTYSPPQNKLNEFQPPVLYTTDILSTTKVGCDPEGARRLMSSLENAGLTETFTDYLLDRTDQENPEMRLLKELIYTMANQVRHRYGSRIAPITARSLDKRSVPQPPELEGSSFSTYINTAETPTQVIARGMVWSAHQHRDLINKDDISGPDVSKDTRDLLCATTAFEIIKNASVVNGSLIALTDEVQIKCGKFYPHNPTKKSDDTNELSGIGIGREWAQTDLINTKRLMNQLTPSELEIFYNLLTAPHLVSLKDIKSLADKQDIVINLMSKIEQLQNYIDQNHFDTCLPNILANVAFNNKSASSTSTSGSPSHLNQTSTATGTSARSNNTTAKIAIKYDAGYGNSLFIRGEGADLSWDQGVELKYSVEDDEWVWETPSTFNKCEFKILINDSVYETGPNHVINFGSTIQHTPHFPHE